MFDRTAHCKEQSCAPPPSTPRTAGWCGPARASTRRKSNRRSPPPRRPHRAGPPRRSMNAAASCAAHFSTSSRACSTSLPISRVMSAAGCEYYAEHAPGYITDEPVDTDASRSLVAFEPLGTVFAVLLWFFLFWLVFCFVVSVFVAGFSVLLLF